MRSRRMGEAIPQKPTVWLEGWALIQGIAAWPRRGGGGGGGWAQSHGEWFNQSHLRTATLQILDTDMEA